MWMTDIVAAGNDVGSWNSIALGSDDVIHISYYDASNGNLAYARGLPGPKWRHETVVHAGDVGQHNTLVLASNGQPHVVYHDATEGKMGHARRTDDGWEETGLHEQPFAAGSHPHMDLGPTDHPHIVFHEGQQILSYYIWRAGMDVISRHLISRRAHTECALALDADHNAHVTYLDFCPWDDCNAGQLDEWAMHATNATKNGEWITERVVSLPSFDYFHYPAIAVGLEGVVHIVYVDRHAGALLHLTNGSGAWEQSIIDDSGVAGGTSMVVGARGHVHVSYTTARETRMHLKYASNASGAWASEVVASHRRIGHRSSIAFDRWGQAHISYHNESDGDLRHAVQILGVVDHPA
jgi:hypothetical protein